MGELMATFKYADLGGGVDMLATTTSGLFDYDFSQITSTTIKFYDDKSNYTSFTGTGFKATTSSGRLTDITAGTLTGIKVVFGGNEALTVTGLNLSAPKVADTILPAMMRHSLIWCSPATMSFTARNIRMAWSAVLAMTR